MNYTESIAYVRINYIRYKHMGTNTIGRNNHKAQHSFFWPESAISSAINGNSICSVLTVNIEIEII